MGFDGSISLFLSTLNCVGSGVGVGIGIGTYWYKLHKKLSVIGNCMYGSNETVRDESACGFNPDDAYTINPVGGVLKMVISITNTKTLNKYSNLFFI